MLPRFCLCFYTCWLAHMSSDRHKLFPWVCQGPEGGGGAKDSKSKEGEHMWPVQKCCYPASLRGPVSHQSEDVALPSFDSENSVEDLVRPEALPLHCRSSSTGEGSTQSSTFQYGQRGSQSGCNSCCYVEPSSALP